MLTSDNVSICKILDPKGNLYLPSFEIWQLQAAECHDLEHTIRAKEGLTDEGLAIVSAGKSAPENLCVVVFFST